MTHAGSPGNECQQLAARTVFKYVGLAALGLFAYAFVRNFGELKRYVKISTM